ncbi:tRNA (adenine(58)-N(1))-methyltransferase catalytic subunit TRMT61A-like, partial [Zeugodacus cucurbitae]|uniref:tRNA (adenine(58)-N(1))-methyltransferase catalytic subunit TRMT61A-like n=1 Tax=Zeugodacus cucurbitae TaxID=28588 RepID=UPI0023D9606F
IGTSSGAKPNFLYAIKPFGHLHKLDIHEVRVQQAREELERHGLGAFATVYHRDVCQLGFANELEGKAVAVFLNLPAPQLAVPLAAKTQIKGKTFLINFHLVLRNHNVVVSLYKDMDLPKLVQWKFYSKSMDVKTRTLPVLDLEFLKYKKLSSQKLDEFSTSEINERTDPTKTLKETKTRPHIMCAVYTSRSHGVALVR